MIIENTNKLSQTINREKKDGKSVLIKKGVFDILHPGHIYALKQLHKTADTVIIFIQSDNLTAKKKGHTRPINPQKQRAEVINAVKYIDYVFLDKHQTPEKNI